jgi:hypothetical protein
MKPLSQRAQTGLLITLMVVMVATRFHHEGNLVNAWLPDASMSVFFLGGLLLRSYWRFAVLMALAVAVDWAAVDLAGVSDFCITAAYAALPLAYAVLWQGGRLCRHWCVPVARPLLRVLAVGVIAAALSFLVSNGAFYWFGGRYAAPHLAEYLARAWQWGPLFVSTTTAYLLVALAGYYVTARIAAARASALAH